jgi:hypothetical protein
MTRDKQAVIATQPVDAAYFRRTREARFGKPLKEVVAKSPGHLM